MSDNTTYSAYQSHSAYNPPAAGSGSAGTVTIRNTPLQSVKKTPCTCNSNLKQPDTQCLICAEKHFSGAYKLHTEAHYTAINRHAVIGDLKLCADHLDRDYPAFADKIRDLRHKISYRRERDTDSLWELLSIEMDHLVTKYLQIDQHGFTAEERSLMSSLLLRRIFPQSCSTPQKFKGKIYIFSNVIYPPKNRIKPDLEDILVFINAAKTFRYYHDHERKLVFHRSPKRDYGDPQPCRNLYIFPDGVQCETIPEGIQKEISAEYDYNYETKKVKCPTTGYYVTQYLRKIFPHAEIILVNMGENVKNSTYRFPAHNWHYEHLQLASLPHLNLEQ